MIARPSPFTRLFLLQLAAVLVIVGFQLFVAP
jgi:hypothetical protein